MMKRMIKSNIKIEKLKNFAKIISEIFIIIIIY